MNICLSCSNHFSGTIQPYRACPIKGCDGEVLSIDDDIVLVIEHLNSLGYITRRSCAGNVDPMYFTSTYIDFYDDIKFDHLPAGFSIYVFSGIDDFGDACKVTRIVKDYDPRLNSYEKQLAVWETAKDLLEWVKSLEKNNN